MPPHRQKSHAVPRLAAAGGHGLQMDDEQRYLFDLQGYLVIEGAVSDAQIARANAVIDSHFSTNPPTQRGTPNGAGSLSQGSPALAGEHGQVEFKGMLGWPQPEASVFRELLVHPQTLGVMMELLDDGFRLDHTYGIVMTPGTEGHIMHYVDNASVYYRYHNGTMRTGMMVASYLLADQGEADGGFAVVPGSVSPACCVYKPIGQELYEFMELASTCD